MLQPHELEAVNKTFEYEEGESFCQSKALTRGGNSYGEGECVVLAYEDEPLFGYIASVFHFKRKDYLFCELLLINCFNSHFNSYETEKSGYFEFIEFDDIYDFHPIGVNFIALKMLVRLHHKLNQSSE